jgi:hypothetical protein
MYPTDQRSQWEVEFPVETVEEAALNRLDFHEAKLLEWATEKVVAERDLRENGIDFNKLANSSRHSTYSGASFDHEKLDRLQAVTTRISVHQKAVDELNAYCLLFSQMKLNRVERIILRYDDVIFFKMVETVTPEQDDED